MFLSSTNRFIKIELKYLEVIKWNCCNKSFRKQKEVWEGVAQWKSVHWAIGSIPGIANSKQTGRGTPMNLICPVRTLAQRLVQTSLWLSLLAPFTVPRWHCIASDAPVKCPDPCVGNETPGLLNSSPWSFLNCLSLSAAEKQTLQLENHPFVFYNC